MEILRIEESQRYGYLFKASGFEKFFADSVAGGKDKALSHLKRYLANAPKLFPHREIFNSEEFKEFYKSIEGDIQFEFTKFNELKITNIVTKVQIKNSIKTTYWILTVTDQNGHTHVFDYDLNKYPTKQSAVAEFNSQHGLNLEWADNG